MKSESNLILAVWEIFASHVPASQRTDAAITMIRAFEEFGIDEDDMTDVLDEDDYLTAAYRAVYGDVVPEFDNEIDHYDE
jgi:hypothetical protein